MRITMIYRAMVCVMGNHLAWFPPCNCLSPFSRGCRKKMIKEIYHVMTPHIFLTAYILSILTSNWDFRG